MSDATARMMTDLQEVSLRPGDPLLGEQSVEGELGSSTLSY